MENKVAVDYSKIDYVGGICPKNNTDDECYFVHFTGGNELVLYHKKPVFEYQMSVYIPREKFIETWKSVINQ